MDMLEEIYNTFSPVFSSFGKVYIAGGAVRDTLLGREPKDYDVFVCSKELDQLGRKTWGTLDEGIELIAYGELHDRNIAKVVHTEFDETSSRFAKVNMDYKGKRVQIIGYEGVDTLDELFDQFDWNICMFGYNGNYYNREEIDNVGEGRNLILHHTVTPYLALRRGFRFTERYRMNLPNSEIDKIIVKSIKQKYNVTTI